MEKTLKYLPHSTLLIWLLMLLGYGQIPDIILQPFVKFPLIILLSIFLPVSFWLLQKAQKRGLAVLFLGIFFVNIGVPIYGWIFNQDALANLREETKQGIEPGLAELLVSGEKPEERATAAGIIYERFGVGLPYLRSDGQFIAYSPDKNARDQFISNHERNREIATVIKNLEYQNDAIAMLVTLQLIIFMSLIFFLILYDRDHKAEQQ